MNRRIRTGNISSGGSVLINQGDKAKQEAAAGAAGAAGLGAEEQDERPVVRTPDLDVTRNVFVVHGRDAEFRHAIFGLLQRLDLHPLDWEDMIRATGQASPFVGDVVAAAPALAQAALVLMTPDDLVKVHGDLLASDDSEYERRLTGQPRPNVILELGMVLMAYPERTVLVEAGTLRPITDLAGRAAIRFDGSAEAVGKLVQRLKLAGCRVNDGGSDWRDLKPFEQLSAYRRDANS